MAVVKDFRLYYPLFTTQISDETLTAALALSSVWSAQQTTGATVFSTSSLTRAECAYALAQIAEGLAFDAAQNVGTVKLQDRGETTIGKDAVTALQGMGNKYLSDAQGLMQEAVTDPANLTIPTPKGIGWSF
jgi:hypothetical protein